MRKVDLWIELQILASIAQRRSSAGPRMVRTAAGTEAVDGRRERVARKLRGKGLGGVNRSIGCCSRPQPQAPGGRPGAGRGNGGHADQLFATWCRLNRRRGLRRLHLQPVEVYADVDVRCGRHRDLRVARTALRPALSLAHPAPVRALRGPCGSSHLLAVVGGLELHGGRRGRDPRPGALGGQAGPRERAPAGRCPPARARAGDGKPARPTRRWAGQA